MLQSMVSQRFGHNLATEKNKNKSELLTYQVQYKIEVTIQLYVLNIIKIIKT